MRKILLKQLKVVACIYIKSYNENVAFIANIFKNRIISLFHDEKGSNYLIIKTWRNGSIAVVRKKYEDLARKQNRTSGKLCFLTAQKQE